MHARARACKPAQVHQLCQLGGTSEVVDAEFPNSSGAIIVDESGLLLLGHLLDLPLVALLAPWVLQQPAIAWRPALIHGHRGRLVQANANRRLHARLGVDQHLANLQPHNVLKVETCAISLAMEGDLAHGRPRNGQVAHMLKLLSVHTLDVRIKDHVCTTGMGPPLALLRGRARCACGCHWSNLGPAGELGLGEVHANCAAPHGQWHHRHADRLDELLVEVGVPEALAELPELLSSDALLEVQPLDLLQEAGTADQALQPVPPALGLPQE
mmetsp:Transcript_71614/g.209907  ORF Transcript_71614/g.209907 Transcript_71614/m.209907 type:complete len:270 (-) Transcript_71614:167-976(-)